MKDDREEMVASFSGNQFQTHSQVLRHAMLSWVTGGVFIGQNRSYLSVDVDDIFLSRRDHVEATPPSCRTAHLDHFVCRDHRSRYRSGSRDTHPAARKRCVPRSPRTPPLCST